MYSLLIKNATVIDGSGEPGEVLDVAVEGQEIIAVAREIKTGAQTVVDGSGLVLTPGFIDPQDHSDVYWQLFDNPTLDSLVTQGFTSILVGNCGASLAPLLSPEALLSIQKWHSLEGANLNWQTFSEYLQELSSKKFACNVASLVGYSTLRRGIVGDQIRALEKPELESLKGILEQSLRDGAFGLSSGLSYAHEIIVSELEMFELAKIIKQYNALLSVHLRSEGGEIVEAVEEALDIARNTEVNLKISHLKIRNEHNWEKLPQVLDDIEIAYHKGANVHFDAYPYDTIWQVLYAYLPRWAFEGGRQVMLKHFNDPIQHNKILMHLNNLNVRFSDVIIASTTNHMNVIGKRIGQIAKNLDVSSEQAVLHLLEHGGSEVLVFEKNLDEQQVRKLTHHPLSFIGTDGAGFGTNQKDRLVHPRCFGSATKFLHEVISEKSLPLEKAVAKLTSGPAKKIGLSKRGEIKIGNYADLVLFDKNAISDKATYENPYQFSQGIHSVIVNGRAVVQDGQLTGTLPGVALRRE